MYRAREVSLHEAPELYRLVQRLAQRAGIPMPRVYIIPSDAPNAFATGRNPQHGALAVTEGILRLLDEDELAGVLAHELGHIRNRDTLIMTVAATLAGAITMLAHMAQWGAIFGVGRRDNEDSGGGMLSLLFMAILAPDRRDADPTRHLALARIFRRQHGGGHRGSAVGVGRRAGKVTLCFTATPHGSESCDRASVHREPADRGILGQSLQYPSTDRRTNSPLAASVIDGGP